MIVRMLALRIMSRVTAMRCLMDRTHPQSKVAGSLIKLEALGLTPGGTNFLSLCHFKGDWTIMAQIFFD